MNNYQSLSPEIQYQDTKFMWIGIPLMSIFVVHVGMEEALSAVLYEAWYYENLVISLAIAYLVFFSIRAVIVGFDEWMPWRENQRVKRWVLQLLVSGTITTFWLLVNEVYDFIMIEEDRIMDTFFLTIDWPVSLLLVLGINYYYYVQYQLKQGVVNPATESIPTKEKILLKTTAGYHWQMTAEIVYAYLENKITYIVDRQGKKRAIQLSLSALEEELQEPSTRYFRINRNLLIRRDWITAYKTVRGHRLLVEMNPMPVKAPIVSKNKAASFKQWFHH